MLNALTTTTATITFLGGIKAYVLRLTRSEIQIQTNKPFILNLMIPRTSSQIKLKRGENFEQMLDIGSQRNYHAPSTK